MLEEQGYGKACSDLHTDQIAAFIDAIPDFKQNLCHYPHKGNRKICDFLDKLLENCGQTLRQYSHHQVMK